MLNKTNIFIFYLLFEGGICIRLIDKFKNIKRTLRTIRYIWIICLFLSPFIGFISLLILNYIAIIEEIDWDLSFTGKKMPKIS